MSSRKSSGAVSRALLSGLALVLLVGAAAAWKAWNRAPTKPETDEGRGVAEAFLDMVRAGRAGDAWDAATAEFKSIEGRESFVRSAAKQPLFKDQLHFVSMQEVRVKDEPRAEYIFQSDSSKMVRVLVGYDAGAWKVDRLTL